MNHREGAERLGPRLRVVSGQHREQVARYEYAAHWADNRTVLDLDCDDGHGPNVVALRARRVTALSSTPQFAQRAARRYRLANLTFAVADYTALGFAANSFDLMLSVSAPDRPFVLQTGIESAARLLKPGGRLIIAVLHAGWQPPEQRFPALTDTARRFTPADLHDALVNTFVVEEIIGQATMTRTLLAHTVVDPRWPRGEAQPVNLAERAARVSSGAVANGRYLLARGRKR